MTRRYYVPELMTCGGVVSLPDEEAMHAVRVMRVSVGDPVELFDGLGNQATGEVFEVSKRNCVCRIDAPVAVDREPTTKLTFAIAMPKPDRAKEMIERLTEMGVTEIQPIVFERTQRGPTDSLIGKLERIVVESCKQSGRNRLMPILPTMTFRQWISGYRERIEADDSMDARGAHRTEIAANQTEIVAWVAMPGGQPISIQRDSLAQSHCVTVIGPEGGLTETELQDCLDASMKSIDLGKRILRVETAACVVAARILED